MSDAIYTLLLGWSQEQIEAQGLTRALQWEMWQRMHPWLAALLAGAYCAGLAMVRRNRFGL